LLLKREGLFNAFANLEMKVIKSITKEEFFFVICPSYARKSKLIKENEGAAARKPNQVFLVYKGLVVGSN
jgi:hypothetical protein